MLNFKWIIAFPILLVSSKSFAVSKYQVSLRVGLHGHSPFSVNTIAKSGKKTFISEFSEDGNTETIVELYTKSAQMNNKNGLFMNVAVTKKVKGLTKITEHAQLFAPENHEMEVGMNSKGKMAGNLALAVMAHKL